MLISFFLSSALFPWRDVDRNHDKWSWYIARVLGLYKSCWAAMNKIFIDARLYVNKDFVHDDVFSCVFRLFILSTKYPKIEGNDEKLSGIFGI